MRQRIVIDTNVYVSRLIRAQSTPGRAVGRAWSEATTLVSADTLDELRMVLWRQKLARYVQPDRIEPFLAQVWEIALHVANPSPIRACRDPRDDKFLEVAIQGRADAIVTGDADLMALHPFRGVAILTPAEYLEQK